MYTYEVGWHGPDRHCSFFKMRFFFFWKIINRITSAKFFGPVRIIHRQILRINFFFWLALNKPSTTWSVLLVYQCKTTVYSVHLAWGITFSEQARIFFFIIFVGIIKLLHEYTARKQVCYSYLLVFSFVNPEKTLNWKKY